MSRQQGLWTESVISVKYALKKNQGFSSFHYVSLLKIFSALFLRIIFLNKDVLHLYVLALFNHSNFLRDLKLFVKMEEPSSKLKRHKVRKKVKVQVLKIC